MSPPWWVPGEPGGAQGQLLGSRVGLCSGHSQGGEEGEVCAAGAHSLGGNVGTPHGPPCQAQTPKQLVSCYSLLGPSQHSPGPPNPSGGSWNKEKASGSSGSTLGIKGQEEEGWGGSNCRLVP